MTTSFAAPLMKDAGDVGNFTRSVDISVGLLTGGQDRHYASGLATALVRRGVSLDVIGSDEVDSPEFQGTPGIRFLNLRGSQRLDVTLAKKILRVLIYYMRLVRYASNATPKIFHILWNNKFEFFDRTVLMMYYKLLGKKIVFTAHNVNAGRRDLADSLPNRLTLRMQYRLADHIFVHTEKMKRELLTEFGVRERAVTVIPYGINNAVPNTNLTPTGAKLRLGVSGARTVLFFGAIAPYKGLDCLVAAFQKIAARNSDYRLIIAGKPKGGCAKYLEEIQQAINHGNSRERIIQRIGYVLDEEMEVYFKAADLLVLPYTDIFQSGIFFLGYSFGLPVVATDVGSFEEDIIEGRTGFLCRPGDPDDLARTIERYFASDLFRNLDQARQDIRNSVNTTHSWNAVAEMTQPVYTSLLQKAGSSPS